MITTALTFLKANKLVAGLGAALLLAALVGGMYFKGRSDGKQIILERLEKAQVKAEKEAKIASDIADENQVEGDAKDNAELDALKKEIENAKEAGSNPLDAIFGGVSEAN